MLHQNQFVRLTTLGIIVLSLALAGCATTKPMWGDPETGLILKYNIAQDQVLNYKSSADTKQSMEMMGQSMESTSKIAMDYSIKGTGSDDQNNFLTQVTINDFSLSNASAMQGEQTLDTSALKGKSFGLTLSPKGKEVEFPGIDDLPKINLGPMAGGEQSVNRYFLDLLPDLPDEPIKVGGTWPEQKEQKVQQGPLELTIKSEATHVIEGLETIKGMECVKIKSQGKSTVEGSGNAMGTDLKVKGDVKSTGTWYFAYEKGIFVKASTEEDSDAKIDLGQMGEMPTVTKTKIELDLIL